MGYVFIVQTEANRYKLGRSNALKEGVVWSLETQHETTCMLLLRKKLERYSCTDFNGYELPSLELHNSLAEIELILASYIEAEDQSNAFALGDSTNNMLPASDKAKALLDELDIVKERLALLECEKTFLENSIKALIGNAAGIQGVATWKTSIIKRLDNEIIKSKYPDIYQACLKETKSRRFLTARQAD